MKKLEESDIIEMLREEWETKISNLHESVNTLFKGKVDGKEKILPSPGLKIYHKDTPVLYTVVSVSPRDVILKTPEGKQFKVDKDVLEKEYQLGHGSKD